MSTIAWGKLRKDATTVLEGEFLGVLDNMKAGKSQNGNDYVKGVVKITAGPYAGRSIPVNFTLTEKSMGLFFQNMADLGLGEEFFNGIDGQGMEPVAAALNGVTAEFTVEKRTWNGQDRENVTKWKRTGITGLSTSTASAIPAATSLPAAVPAASEIPAPPPAPGEDDGDPF